MRATRNKLANQFFIAWPVDWVTSSTHGAYRLGRGPKERPKQIITKSTYPPGHRETLKVNQYTGREVTIYKEESGVE